MTANARSLRELFRRRYVAGLIALAGLACASLFIFFEQTAQQSGGAALINLASSQKALSQRVSFFVNAISASDIAAERETLRTELKTAIGEMRAAQEVLSGAQTPDRRMAQKLAPIREIYMNDYAPFEHDVAIFLSSAEQFLEDLPAPEETTLISEVNLLGMHTIMQTYDVIARIIANDAERALAQAGFIQSVLMLLFIIVLTAESFIIFEPMGKKIEQSVRDSELAQEQAQREAARARQAGDAKSNFLRLMSHELRTPLNAVIGMSKLLRGTDLSGPQLEYAKHIDDAGHHMLSIADDILTVNQQSAGKLKFKPAPTRIDDELRSVVAMLKQRAEEKTIELTYDNKIAHGDVVVDGVRFRQVVFNLIGNAIKFTDTGSIAISAASKADPDDDKSEAFEIRVTDTGCGIAKEDQERIFEEFGQAHALGERAHAGVGLGLAISRSIAEMMGGTLSLESSSTSGSVFLFSLTLQRAKIDGKKTATNAANNSASTKTGKVLVVDDNLPNRMIAAAFLKKAGFSVEFAENGKEAVEAVAHHSDLAAVLMDIEMPVMDGITATRAVRARTDESARMPIIALTAHALPEDRDNLIAEGFDDVLRKPASETEIVRCVRHYAFERAAA